MLPAATRMRRRGEFTATARGARVASPPLVVHFAPVAHPGVRIGFSVGRSVGPAVVRNLVRRRLRHVVRARLSSLPDGTSIVVRATPSAAAASSDALSAAFDRAVELGRRRLARA